MQLKVVSQRERSWQNNKEVQSENEDGSDSYTGNVARITT